MKTLFWPRSVEPAVAANSAMRPRPSPEVYSDGELVTIPGVSFGKSDYTLLLVTQKSCRYCEQSMPFYKALGDDRGIAKRTKIVLLAPDDERTSWDELGKHGVRVDQVVRTSLGSLKISGTPTAIVVNRQGIVERALTGLLDEERQTQLLAALRAPGI
jgi:thioredoxin-related protein